MINDVNNDVNNDRKERKKEGEGERKYNFLFQLETFKSHKFRVTRRNILGEGEKGSRISSLDLRNV